MQRRQYLAAVSVAAGTLVAGCLGDDNSDDNNADDTTPDQPAGNQTDQDSTGDGDDTDASGDDTDSLTGPIELTEAVLTAASQENVDRFRELLHPTNPGADTPEGELNLGTIPVDDPDITIQTRDPSVETIYEDIDRAEQTLASQERQLQHALTDGAAIISIRLTSGDQRPNGRLLWVVATNKNGDWRLLFQGLPAKPRELPGISTQVLGDIVFDSGAAVARVELASEPPVAELSVSSGVADELFEIGQDQQSEPTISIAEDGGELAVDLRRGDELVALHRELYGDQRVVKDITIEQTDQEGSNRSKVEFTDQFDADEIGLTTTRLGSTATASGGRASENESESTVAGIDALTIGVAPQHDELIVTLTRDGDQTDVHRERLYYNR